MHKLHSSSAILHIDADAFFASCEQAIHPEYKGKPVITGKERGIVAAVSYEAKKLGISRSTPLFDIKKICPDAIIVPSDYETYSLFSKRIYSIIRRFTPTVEEYSIDEAFADISGLRRPLNMSYPQIALKIKERIETELGLTVSVGLAPTKVLAKIGSKWKKPSGFTSIPTIDIDLFLKDLPVEKVWGIGPQTTRYLNKCGITTAGQFAKKTEGWVKSRLTKPHIEVWKELNGESVYPIVTEEKDDYKSISKFKTFTPPSSDRSYVFSMLSKNVENALIKARRHKLAARKIIIRLRTQEFRHSYIEGKLNRPSAYPNEIMPLVEEMFEKIYKPGVLYRSTGAVLWDLQEITSLQLSLFEDPLELERTRKIYGVLDESAVRYGKHTMFLAASLKAQGKAHLYERGDIPQSQELRKDQLCKRKFLGLPFLLGKIE